MKRAGTRHKAGAASAVAVGAALAVAASCRTVSPTRPREPVATRGAAATTQPAPTPAPPAELPVALLAPEPRLRVAVLTDAARTSLGADSGVVMWLLDASGAFTGEKRVLPRATFLATGARAAAGPGAPKFRAQVGSFAEESGAQAVARRVQETVHLAPSVVASGKGTLEVRVGEFDTREEAQRLAVRLGRSGFPGAFAVREAAAPPRGRIRLLESGEELEAAAVSPVVATESIAADTSAYSGYLEVRAADGGVLTLVNVVNVDEYLRGVVPSELSPLAFPEIEALKAQAVAARTYALRNRGEYAQQGYDICATPACQVYRGRSAENALSDRAVLETKGLVVAYQGALINALYTSTCGGHTEDAENVFDADKAEPYLRGVVCAPERSAWAAIKTTAVPTAFPEGDALARDAALLVALDVLEPRMYTAAALKGVAGETELRAWTGRLVLALHRRACASGADGGLSRRGNFLEHLVARLCWEERAERLLNPGDSEYLLRLEDEKDLRGEGERKAAALLIEEGILSPFSDNTLRPAAALTRAQAVEILARTAEKAGAPGFVTAKFHGVAEAELTVVGPDESEHAYPLDGAVRLFRDLEGVRAAASELSLAVGDQVRYVLRDGQVVYLEGEQSRRGVAADRDSKYYRWEVRMTPAEVARAIGRYGVVGHVRDVVPRKVGVSGRVVELAVLGSREREEVVLHGLKVRFGLGLRENLFVIERETDQKGAVERFVFTGKGWGHGVGLCQVGAFGMARSGSTGEQILQHYYTGVELQKAY